MQSVKESFWSQNVRKIFFLAFGFAQSLKFRLCLFYLLDAVKGFWFLRALFYKGNYQDNQALPELDVSSKLNVNNILYLIFYL